MNAWIKVLKSYKRKGKSVKVLFLYPSSPNPVIRSGPVLKIETDCFEMDDVEKGVEWFAYTYISSIKGVGEDGTN